MVKTRSGLERTPAESEGVSINSKVIKKSDKKSSKEGTSVVSEENN